MARVLSDFLNSPANADCDTADDIPETACNPLWLSELLFDQLRLFNGIVFTGAASQTFESDVEWGKAIRVSDHELMQFRVYPRGMLSSGKLLEMKSSVMMVAARRRAGLGKDTVTFAILWHPEIEQQRLHSITPFDELRGTSQSVSARCLHMVLPSLFNHHDAKYAAAQATTPPTKKAPAWPVLDDFHYHAVRPSSFTVHRPVKVGDQSLMTVTASPGVSQFVLAGQFAGIDIEDPPHRACEPCSYPKWSDMIEKYSLAVVDHAGLPKGVSSMMSAMTVCDLLSCEGMLGILSHSFVAGALPDLMHSPNGIPLLIAFATRLACYPERFGLAGGTPADKLANDELVSMFESMWDAICPVKAGSRNVYAIDIVIKTAYNEAKQAARKHGTTQAVEDNLTFWQRAGQRCVTALFGPQLEDFLPVRTEFGRCEQLQDPLMEARSQVISKQMSALDASTGGDGAVMLNVASREHKKTMLMTVVNSVENWLRTGSYCSMQIHKKNKVAVRIQRPGPQKMMSKSELRNALQNGMEDSVKEMLESGEYEDEHKARAAAQVLADGIEEAFKSVADDEQVDFNDLKMQLPWSVVDKHAALNEMAAAPATPGLSKDDEEQIDSESWDGVCHDAFNGGKSALSASMCQGPMVHHQFSMGCFLSSPYTVNKCADCDAHVHVLSATFLGSRYAHCPRCNRSRCIPCTALLHSRGRPSDFNPMDASRPCKRCRVGKAKPAADGSGSQKTAPKPATPAPGGSKAKGRKAGK